MGRVRFSGPIKSVGGFEIGVAADGMTAETNTEVISSSGELKNQVAKTDGIVVYGAGDVKTIGGTYTLTRVAVGDLALVKTDAADTSYIIADISELIRTTSSKGLKLTSVDICYKNATLALTSGALVINKVTYANGVANAIAAFGGTLSGSPAGGITLTASATPYVVSITLGTPIFNVTALNKVELELAIVAGATSAFSFYAFVLHFTHDLM